MTKPLHNARTGSARPAEYHIVFRDGMYKIFDKAQRSRPVSPSRSPFSATSING